MPVPPAKLAQLQHEIHIHLAQALYHGWQYATTPAHATYNRPPERPYPPSGVVTQGGEMDFMVTRYVTEGQERVEIGVETVITAAQYRRALKYLPAEHQQRILLYLGSRAMPGQQYPALEPGQLTAFSALAAALNLQVREISRKPTEERNPLTLRDFLTPPLEKRPRRRAP